MWRSPIFIMPCFTRASICGVMASAMLTPGVAIHLVYRWRRGANLEGAQASVRILGSLQSASPLKGFLRVTLRARLTGLLFNYHILTPCDTPLLPLLHFPPACPHRTSPFPGRAALTRSNVLCFEAWGLFEGSFYCL